jgi:predicted small lipoprotein YifL
MRRLLFRRLAAVMTPIIIASSHMKELTRTMILIPMVVAVLSGCGTSGPSPEQQTREAQQEKDAERQQAEFRKGLPPVSNPGQGW